MLTDAQRRLINARSGMDRSWAGAVRICETFPQEHIDLLNLIDTDNGPTTDVPWVRELFAKHLSNDNVLMFVGLAWMGLVETIMRTEERARDLAEEDGCDQPI